MDFGEKTIALAFENVGLALDMWAELRDSGESLSGGKVILRGPFGYCQG